MKTKVAILDRRVDFEIERRLALYGYRVITLPPSPRLSAPIASHPDMLVSIVDGELVTTADYCDAAAAEISLIYDSLKTKFHFTGELHGEKYPGDVLFNCLILGKLAFARQKSLSPYLKELLTSKGYKLINVNQGYPACTALRLSPEAAITADSGMERALLAEGIRVYKIEDGGISLPPYPHGFIGGAGGCDGSRVFFLGDYKLHPSADIIGKAIAAEGLSAVCLSDAPLADLGGILFAEGDID